MARWTAGDRGPPGPRGQGSMSTWGTRAHEQRRFSILCTQRLRIGHCSALRTARLRSVRCPAPRSAPRQTLPRTRAPHARKATRPGPPAGLEAPLFFFFFELLSILSYLGLLNPSAGHLRPWSLSAAPDANSTGGNAFKVAPAPMKDTSKLREPVTAAPAGWIGPPPPGRSPVQPSLFSSLPGPCLGPGPADPPSNQGAGALELINGRQ